MKKKLLSLLLVLSMLVGAVSVLASCGGGCDQCVDKNDDGFCDVCEEEFEDGCDATHKDANDDGKCDVGGEAFQDGCDAAHKDANDDGKCDFGGEAFTDGCDPASKCLDTDGDGKCDNEGCDKATTNVPCTHVDKNDDKKCDECGEDFEDGCDAEHRDANDDGKCDFGGEAFDDGKEDTGVTATEWAAAFPLTNVTVTVTSTEEGASDITVVYFVNGEVYVTEGDETYLVPEAGVASYTLMLDFSAKFASFTYADGKYTAAEIVLMDESAEGVSVVSKAKNVVITLGADKKVATVAYDFEQTITMMGQTMTQSGKISAVFSAYGTTTAPEVTPECEHVDADDDLFCDNCDEPFDDGVDLPSCEHVDENEDGICDNCEAELDTPCEHRDADDDWSCDYCGEYFEDAHEVHYDYDDDGVCDYSSWNEDYTVETPCGEPCDDGCDNMIDADDDGKCDNCDEAYEDGCDNHVDANADGKCDVADCGIDMPGTELNPIQVEIDVNSDYVPTGFTVVVPAGKTVYYVAYNIGGTVVTINAAVTVVVGENTYTPDAEGVITFVAEGNGRMPVSFAITNDGAEDVTVAATLAYPEGSMNNPFDLTLGDITVDVEAGNQMGVFYSWTAIGNGVVKVTVKGNLTEGGAFGIQISNSNSYAVLNFTDATYNEADDVTVITMEVTKGDVLVFTFASEPVLPDWNIPAVTIEANVAFECAHVDANDNAECDNCDEEFEDGCDVHVDADGDYVCDTPDCGEHVHRDADDDLKCDDCGEDFDDAPEAVDCDHRDADDDYICDKCGNDYRDACDIHIDADDNLRCDKCNIEYDDGQDVEDIPETPDRTDKFDDISWDVTEVVMQLNLNTSGNELSALTKRYMAGEDGEGERIDDYVMERNDAAYDTTAVYPTYIYLEETDKVGWGAYTNRIATDIATFVQGETPDMYCGFAYDLTMSATLGYFKNLYNDGGEKGNHFTFLLDDYRPQYDDEGYLIDFMKSVTPLPETKMYLYASNYTIDVIRSMYVIPVSISLLGQMDVSDLPDGSDRNDDGFYEITEFYDMVRDIQWTYEMMAKLSAAIFSPVASASTNSLNNVNGFVLDTSMGLPSAGMTYAVDFYWAEQKIDENGNYSYVVPKTNMNLEQMAIAYENLFKADGIFMSTSTMEANDVGTTGAGMGIRQRFSEDMMLFGGVVVVGALDYEQYQNMEYGFGIAPIPLYANYAGAEYRTAIHNLARVIAISKESAYFSECTAFLDYQALNSDQVMNQYYRSLQYETVGGEDYNIEILDYLRDHIRSNRDQYLENMCNNAGVGILNSVSGLGDYKWGSFFRNSSFQAATIRGKYEEASSLKNQALAKLVEMYEKLA